MSCKHATIGCRSGASRRNSWTGGAPAPQLNLDGGAEGPTVILVEAGSPESREVPSVRSVGGWIVTVPQDQPDSFLTRQPRPDEGAGKLLGVDPARGSVGGEGEVGDRRSAGGPGVVREGGPAV